MFIVLLRFAGDKAKAGQFMDGHNAWIKRNFDDGVFLLVGTLKPALGGGILAHNTTRADLERRVSEDPFVAEGVVAAEILEFAPAKADERLAFLLGQPATS
ncbi:MAG: YciI family protein [Pseudolabrys sp.]